MELTSTASTIDRGTELEIAAAEILDLTDNFCQGPGGVDEVLADYSVEDLVYVAGDPYVDGGIFTSLETESERLQELLIERYSQLAPFIGEECLKAEAKRSILLMTQHVVAERLFTKVAAEIDSPSGMSDITCDNLTKFKPYLHGDRAEEQLILTDITRRFYDKNIDDHKAGRSEQILRHDGEALGNIGGDSEVGVMDESGRLEIISLDTYKQGIMASDRYDCKKQLADNFNGDITEMEANLRIIEAIPVFAYGRSFQETEVPTRLGKSVTKVSHGAQVASLQVARAAIRTSRTAAQIDPKKAVSTAAILGVVSGVFGLGVFKPAMAEAATMVPNSVSLITSGNGVEQSNITEVDGGVVVSASATEQRSAETPTTQAVVDGGVVVSQTPEMVLPSNPQPVHDIIRLQNKVDRDAVANAAANGDIAAGARALIDSTGSRSDGLPSAEPVQIEVEAIGAKLAKSTVVSVKIMDEVRNMLIAAEAALTTPEILNTITAEQWVIIKGGQDNAKAQSTISGLSDAHYARLIKANSGLGSDVNDEQRRQIADLMASSDYNITYILPNSTQPNVAPTPVPSAPSTQSPTTPRTLDKLPGFESTKLNPQTEKALQAVIDRGGEWTNRGFVLQFLMRNGWTPERASAVVGNLIQESGVSPTSEQQITDPARGMGIVQWSLNDRWQSLLKFASYNHIDPNKLDTQCRFILYEMRGSEKGNYKLFLAATSLREMTLAFSEHYERPSNPKAETRVTNAQTVFDAFNLEMEGIPKSTSIPTTAPDPSLVKPASAAVETPITPTENGGGLVVPVTPNSQLPISDAPTNEFAPPQNTNLPSQPVGPDQSINPGTDQPAISPAVTEKCATGSVSLGIREVYNSGTGSKAELCAIVGLPSRGEESQPGSDFYVTGAEGNAIVIAQYSQNLVDMVIAAKADGIDLQALSSFRTDAHQLQICSKDKGCSDTKHPDNTYVARPTTSKHESGTAIDFLDSNAGLHVNCTGSHLTAGKCVAPDSPTWKWLTSHASSYNFIQYKNESWHWSPSGQ